MAKTFRPSCRVRLQLRLDEVNDVERLRAGLENTDAAISAPSIGSTAGTEAALKANQEARAQVQSMRVTLPKPELQREIARLDAERAKIQREAYGGAVAQKPASLEQKPPDHRTLDLDLMPDECNISRSNLKDASTVDVTMKWSDVPIDPRVVRSALIIAVMGAVSADDWAAGVQGQARREDGSLRSVVNREPGQELRFTSSSRFVGFVDEWSAEFTDDGDTIKMTGRDISALMRDQQLDPLHGIDLELPIALGVTELLSRFPMTRGMKVVYGLPRDPNDPLNQVSEEPLGPVPADSAEKNGPIPGGNGRLKNGKPRRPPRTKKSDERETVWDHITKVLQRLALVPVMRGFTLYLLEPRTLFADPTRRRKMVWGKNLKALSFSRRLGGIKCQTIEIRSPNPALGRTLWARYPVFAGAAASGLLGQGGSPQPTKTRQVVVGPTGAVEETILVQYVRGVTDLKRLEGIARNVFEEIGRQEIEGSLATDDVDSFDSVVEADLLDLQPGDPMEILVAKASSVDGGDDTGIASINPYASTPPVNSISNELQRLTNLSVAQRKEYLKGLGFSDSAAQRLAEIQEQARLTTIFRVGHVNIQYTTEDGISIDADFHNYIYVREDPEAESKPRQSPTTLSGAAAAASQVSK